MKVKLNQHEFSEAITVLQSIAERKTTMPILSNILLTAKRDFVALTATDLEVGTMIQIPAQVIAEGQIAVPARNIADIAREVRSESVLLEALENNWLYIEAGRSQFRLACPDSREFPSLPARESETRFSCSGELVARMLPKVSFAMSRDETRYHLNGVYLDGQSDGILRWVATDGHRLACLEEMLGFPVAYHAIIPRKGASELEKFCARAPGEEVIFFLGEKNLDVQSAGRRLVIRLIDGEFPKYDQVIPKDSDKSMELKREDLIGALRRVCILANERSRGVRLSFSTGHLEINTQNSERGEGKEELECDYRGEFFQVGFNAHYFLDILTAMEGEIVQIKTQGNLGPCLLGSTEDKGWQAVLMPMRI